MCEKHQSIKPKYKNKNTANSSQTEFMRKCQKYAEVNEKQMGLGRRPGGLHGFEALLILNSGQKAKVGAGQEALVMCSGRGSLLSRWGGPSTG